MDFGRIRDSSIWENDKSNVVARETDSVLKIGTVKDVINDINGELRYTVEVLNKGVIARISCKLLRRFGGVYNYEDYVYQGYNVAPTSTQIGYTAKAGDSVIVGQINGRGSEGIILGGVTHIARNSSTALKAAGGPQYNMMFNGINNSINSSGEWTLTFMGLPTNIKVLNDTAKGPIPAPKYDTKIGSTFIKIDKTGGYTVSDNANETPQTIKIDKAAGTVSIISGKIVLTLTKKSEAVSLTSKSLAVNASESISKSTKKYTLSATTSASIKSPKVAIGTSSIELLDQIIKAIEKLGLVTPISPVGPCTPLQATPQWAQVLQIQNQIKSIKGSIS